MLEDVELPESERENDCPVNVKISRVKGKEVILIIIPIACAINPYFPDMDKFLAIYVCVVTFTD